jgi:Coenzyme PQQ synthesis protein D (PqqD)
VTRNLRKIESAFCATEVDGELVMIDANSGKFFSIKGVGLDIWHALDGQADLSAICANLAQSYRISRNECEAAVNAFADQLVSAGFAEFA